MLFLPPLQLDMFSSPREDESAAASEAGDGGAFAPRWGAKCLSAVMFGMYYGEISS